MASEIPLTEKIKVAKVKFMAEAGALALEIVRKNAPVATGAFRDSLRPEVAEIGEIIEINITSDSDKPKMVWLTEGTSAHTILPVSAQVLSWSSNGNSVFASSVNHPGTQANDFGKKSIDELEPLLEQLFLDILKEVL